MVYVNLGSTKESSNRTNMSIPEVSVTQFNSLVTCSFGGCSNVARGPCPLCNVCYYCSKDCQDKDWNEKHEVLCLRLKNYHENSIKLLPYIMKSSNIQSINAWLHTYPDLLKLMKERKAWLEVIVSYEMPEASVTNQVRACLNNMNECPKMVHICHLPNVDVKLPKEVPQTFGSNRLVICPKDIQGRSDTFFQMIQDDKQTSVIIFINIAGIIHLNPSDSSRMGKLTAKNTCKNLRVDGKVREAIIDAAGKHWNKSGNAFGRSLGFWIKLPEPNVISDNFKGNMSELVERLTGKKTESTYKKREDDKKEKEKKQE